MRLVDGFSSATLSQSTLEQTQAWSNKLLQGRLFFGVWFLVKSFLYEREWKVKRQTLLRWECIHEGVSVHFLSQYHDFSWPTQRTYTGHEQTRTL